MEQGTRRLGFKQNAAIPGFGLTLGYTVAALVIVILVPLSGLAIRVGSMGASELRSALASDRVLSAFRVSFSCAFAAALVNVLFGSIVAWVLVRYRFPGKRILDAMIDLPLALPTAVAGIALTTLYAPNGWLGSLVAPLGVQVAFRPLGIVVALVFVGLPFVVRTVQPVIQDFDAEVEGAAASLGASPWQTFWRILFPQILPSMLVGFTMAFARGLGEYGSVIFIAGNLPKVSEIVPLLIVTRLEQYDYLGASALALVMLLVSFSLLYFMNQLQRLVRQRVAG